MSRFQNKRKQIKDCLTLFHLIAKRAPWLTVLRTIISIAASVFLPAETLLISKLALRIETAPARVTLIIVLIVLGIALARGMSGLFQAVTSYLDKLIVYRTEKYVRTEFQNTLSCFEYRFRESLEFSEMAENAARGIDPMYTVSIFGAIPEFVSYVISFILVLLLVGSVRWYLSAIAFLLAFLRVFASTKFTKTMNEMNNIGAHARLEATELKEACMDIAKQAELRSYNKQEWLISRWKDKYLRVNKNVYSLHVKNALFTSLLSVWDKLLTVVMIGLFILLENETSSEAVVLIVTAYSSLELILQCLETSFSTFSAYYYMIGNLIKLLNSPRVTVRNSGNNSDPVAINLEGVSFFYKEGINVLHNLNLTIRPGEKIALVGENGSGKTTLAKIILQLYHPQEGIVCIKDKNGLVHDCRVSTVLQDYVRYELSVRDNIALGDIEKYDQEERILMSLHAVFGSNPPFAINDLVGTKLGKRKLSGGEWQRLAIARAYFREAPLIVLDEPNASIDAFAEAAMIKRMFEMAKDKTCVFITHRLTTTALADRIIVMKDGRICEEGTHEELMRRNGEYARMYSVQAEMYA